MTNYRHYLTLNVLGITVSVTRYWLGRPSSWNVEYMNDAGLACLEIGPVCFEWITGSK